MPSGRLRHVPLPICHSLPWTLARRGATGAHHDGLPHQLSPFLPVVFSELYRLLDCIFRRWNAVVAAAAAATPVYHIFFICSLNLEQSRAHMKYQYVTAGRCIPTPGCSVQTAHSCAGMQWPLQPAAATTVYPIYLYL